MAVSFDAYGDQASAGTRSYAYDALGRLTADTPTAGGSGYAFSYAGKTGTLASDGTSGYAWDPSGSTLAGVGAPGGGTSGVLPLTDSHGDVLGQFTPAGTGVAGSRAYDPWGTVTATTGTVSGMLGFQSAWGDPAAGKDLMGARWYNPAAGDFTSADSVQVPPVPDPAAADPFGYAAGNPLTFTDPTGHLISAGSPATNPNWQADTAYSNVFTQTYQQVGVTRAQANAQAAYNAVIAAKQAAAKLDRQQAAERRKQRLAEEKQQLAEEKQRQEELARAERQRVEYNHLRAMSINPRDKPAPGSSTAGFIPIPAGVTNVAEYLATVRAIQQQRQDGVYYPGCSGQLFHLGACPSEAGAAGITPQQVKQSATGAALVLTSVIPVGDILDLLGGSAAPEAAGLGRLSVAEDYGIWPYRTLRADLRGLGLQTHHLIEQRFAAVMSQDVGDMASIAVTDAERQVFTNAWRQAIPYGPNGTGMATQLQVENAARQIYADFPDVLKVLGL